MSNTTVTVVDKGWSQIQKKIRATGVAYVGLLGAKAAKTYPDEHGYTTAEVGAVHEYNAPNDIPPGRPYIRPTVHEHRRKYIRLLSRFAADEVFGRAPRGTAMLKVGLVVAGDIKLRIARGVPPALSEKTVEARKRRFGKASSKPLIATGQLRSSIDAEVRPK